MHSPKSEPIPITFINVARFVEKKKEGNIATDEMTTLCIARAQEPVRTCHRSGTRRSKKHNHRLQLKRISFGPQLQDLRSRKVGGQTGVTPASLRDDHI